MAAKRSISLLVFCAIILTGPVSAKQPASGVKLKVKKEIMEFLHQFQEGYSRRDPSTVDAWTKKLMVPDVQIIGTHAVYPHTGEWQVGIKEAARLFANDWKRWGVFESDIKNAEIQMINRDAAQVMMFATVTKSVENGYGRSNDENMKRCLKRLAALEKEESKTTRQKLFTAVWDAGMVLKHTELGETLVWPIRISMVLVKKAGKWKMTQTHFSHPMAGYPPVRLVEGKAVQY